MSHYARQAEPATSWIRERFFLNLTVTDYIKQLITPFNVIAAILILPGLYLIGIRFTQGLGAVTSASHYEPWGLFLSWGLFSGVPMSASGFVLGTAVYIFGINKYHPVVKNAILIGFLGYFFAVTFLLIDLGRPWRLPYPMFVSFGTASVLFLVAWHVALYLSCQFLEFSPSIFDWAGLKTLRKWAASLILALTIFGVILSTLHQSALGAMLLLSPGKLHPLWYTPYIPVLFFLSAIAAGLCMVILANFLTSRLLRDQADSEYLASLDPITIDLGTAAAFVLFTYFAVKIIALAHGSHWDLLPTPLGRWFLVEVLIFVLLPSFLFVIGSRKRRAGLVKATAVFTLVGIVVNRFNVSLIALNWNLPHREFVHWKEVLIVISVVTIQILVYRWIVTRMPVLREHPQLRGKQE
jgi:Ni/Fe-hydrogenase subunit HybB-like protein